MKKFKEDGIGVDELLKLIPEDLLMDLAKETNADYQVKKLYAQNVFNLLLYGLLKCHKLGLRTLQDFYNSKRFKYLFRLPDSTKSAKYNSLSARLATMNVEFFEKAFQSVYEECAQLYDESVLSTKYKITRIDSTMVCETAAKLEQGINVGCKKNGKKQVKYTLSLTNLFPSSVEIFTEQTCISENKTIPKAILKVIDKKQDNVFVFDRGVHKRDVFCELDKNEFKFVTRLRDDARHVVLKDIPLPENLKVNNLTILKDQQVYLFSSGTKIVEHPFRLIQCENEKGNKFWFMTNYEELSCEEVVQIYKHRWDIEVFFRFIKQELNFSHLISVNLNGIKILVYMTLILAMLILVYKKINEFGYKTAKRRFEIELEEHIYDTVILYLQANPNIRYP